MIIFADRVEAGRTLAKQLEHLRGQDIVVLGLPRGGIPVAFEVAEALDAPLDVIVVRKLGVPFQPELAMGAIGEDGARVLDSSVLAHTRVTAESLGSVERRERARLETRTTTLRRGRERLDLTGRIALIVDDGIATGSTARVACEVARHLGASRVIVAVPVAPRELADGLPCADEVICTSLPAQFVAVGHHYRDFSATSEEEVIVLLDAAARRMRGDRTAGQAPDCDIDVEIPVGAVSLQGHLHVPEPATGIVVFAHGSGSGRHSPRNRFVATTLHRVGLGTLLLDLLSPAEEVDSDKVFDVELLASRLTAATAWLGARPESSSCRIGYFGASTGAGAALWAAAEPDADVAAVVSRGGRPDLAGPRLADVTSPTLLIVGSADKMILALNRRAQSQLRCTSKLEVVEGATHLFEERGALAEAAILASDWFTRHLAPSTVPSSSKQPVHAAR